MNVEEVRIKLKKIEAIMWDNEKAHSREDELYIAVLQTIADGVDNPKELAKEALKANDLEYARWCA